MVLIAITSQEPGDTAVTIDGRDCVDGELPKRSSVKLSKLFTVHSTLVIKKMCAVRGEKLVESAQSPASDSADNGAAQLQAKGLMASTAPKEPRPGTSSEYKAWTPPSKQAAMISAFQTSAGVNP